MEFPPQIGGVANYLADLASEYPKDSLIVLTPKADDNEQRKYKIYRRRFFSKLIWPHWLPLLITAKKIVKAEKIEKIEVGQVLPVGTVALYLKKKFKLPFRLYTYGMDVTFAQKSERKKKLFQKILKEAEEIITISEYTKKELLKAGAEENKIKIIAPQAHITPTKYDISNEEIKEFLEKYNLNNKKIILTVGRLVERKGQDIVIESLNNVLNESQDVVYLIVGRGEDKERLEKLVKNEKLNNNVVFTGELTNKELAVAYIICNVFIMVPREIAGDFEGYGIVYKEALSFNKPVIAGRSGGAVEAVGQNGKLVDSENKKEISEALISFLK